MKLNTNRYLSSKIALLITVLAVLVIVSSRLRADTGICGGVNVTLPFNDVAGNTFFCQIAAAYFSGLTNGTTANTYSPGNNVNREQMAAFITRTLDQSLKRGSRRAALDQWAIPTSIPSTGRINVGDSPHLVKSDGADLWVANHDSNTVSRVRASDGEVLQTWTDATNARAVVVARNRVFVTGQTSPGSLYRINPNEPAGDVSVVAGNLGDGPAGIAFAGFYLWTANLDGGSISRIDPNSAEVTTYGIGFNQPRGIIYDGAYLWVTDMDRDALLKVNSSGEIIQTINVGDSPGYPIFDGVNIWVPNFAPNSASSVSVVRASSGAVLATLTGNGLDGPLSAAFDGERILITNYRGNSVSLWKATDLSPLGSASAGAENTQPYGACSDGLNFWVTLRLSGRLVRF